MIIGTDSADPQTHRFMSLFNFFIPDFLSQIRLVKWIVYGICFIERLSMYSIIQVNSVL